MAVEKKAGFPTIQLKYPFEKLSRKLTIRKNTCSNSNPTGAISYGGVMYTTRVNKYGMGGRQYFFMRENARSTTATIDELFNRQRFSAIRALVKARAEDMTKIDADIAAFNAQRDEPNGIKSLYGWYWKVCAEEYDKQHPRP